MLSVVIYVEVPDLQAPYALDLGRAAGYTGRLDPDWPSREPGGVTLAFVIDYPDATSDGPEQAEGIARLHQVLTDNSVPFIAVGNGVQLPDSASRFVIAPVGSTDPGASLTVRADDRIDFETKIAMIGHSVSDLLEQGYEVKVFGLAVNDADLQDPPFSPQH